MVMEKVETPSVSIHKWASVWHHFFFGFYDKKLLAGSFCLRQRQHIYEGGGNKGDTSAQANNTTLDFSFAHQNFTTKNV